VKYGPGQRGTLASHDREWSQAGSSNEALEMSYLVRQSRACSRVATY